MSKLAVIIPYYKLKFFGETLDSLEKQTCKDFNLYIGNDASPENPEETIKKHLKNTPYHYFVYEENLGGQNLAKQWERVISESKSEEWFVILGDDDVFSENFVEEFYRVIDEVEKIGSNVIRFGQRWIDENNNEIYLLTDYPEKIRPEDHIHYKIIEKKRSSLSEHIFKKSSYLKFGFRNFPLAWNSDDMAVFEFSDGKPIFFSNKAFVNVHVTQDNISGKSDNTELKLASKKIFEKMLIRKYYKCLRKDTLKQLVNEHVYYKRNHSTPLGYNDLKIYWHLKDYKNFILALFSLVRPKFDR
ncbi:glycosyltransferase family 2 protein [Chryseobacterium taklimakanense]|uniref:glycosyltransferase family 2 protein n=1 Tax=Chryseobacterium taklimakanense TaxID=536441 RepID=UPI000F5FF00F|nr:glycosyltransferase family 2 protein [Chryseobacterium taklimakanense]AZI21928.1 glycosyltransferase family 2 protein [Chryseobacterium taklimakanense]